MENGTMDKATREMRIRSRYSAMDGYLDRCWINRCPREVLASVCEANGIAIDSPEAATLANVWIEVQRKDEADSLPMYRALDRRNRCRFTRSVTRG